MLDNSYYHTSSTGSGSRIALVSMLHRGHIYDRYLKLMPQVVHNHSTYAAHNNWDYFLFNDLLVEQKLAHGYDFNIPDVCLGIFKWYAVHHVLSTGDYDGVLFVDYDSVFLRLTRPQLGDTSVFSPVSGTPYYDPVFLLYYCWAKGVNYSDFVAQSMARKYNTGFMYVTPEFSDLHSLDEFISFVSRVHQQITSGESTWIAQGNLDYSRIQQHHNFSVAPFDEVYLMHRIISESHEPVAIWDPTVYNINNIHAVTPESVHLHFCTHKEQFFDYTWPPLQ